MNLPTIAMTVLAVSACKSDSAARATERSPAMFVSTEHEYDETSREARVPSVTERLELNTDGHAIPASIVVPMGSTVFADEPNSLRIGFDGKDEHGRRESLFAVRIRPGTEYNLDLQSTAEELKKNAYGATNHILEQSEHLLLFRTTVAGFVTHSFSLVVPLRSKPWVCSQGNDGGWTEREARAQVAACQTLRSL